MGISFSAVPTGSPKNVTAQVLDPTSLTLSWAPPLTERTNGLIQRYHVRITELETGQVRELNVTETSVVVSGLHPFYQYRYIVAAVTVGVGPYSVASLVRLPEARMLIQYSSTGLLGANLADLG